jgi:hypothetical protein
MRMDQLEAMEREGMKLWGTPGEGEPYWAKEPRFSFDEGLAVSEEILSANGHMAMTGVSADRVLEFMVEMPPPSMG